MKISFLLFSILFLFNARAFVLPEVYVSGEELCKSRDLNQEFGQYVEVPAFYDSHLTQKTKIYFYTKKKFNQSLPSLLFFTGGPGVSSRSAEFDIDGTNVIFLEQRGISCSKPSEKYLFLNPKFYSSKNTARDALAVLDYLKISKITVYGQSYGTIPATIFASLFPERTNSLVIEGVIYKADHTLWNSEIKKRLIQNLFDQQPKEVQDKILALNSSGILPSTWFSKLAGMVLYLNNGVDIFPTFFANVITMDQDALVSFVSNFYPKETVAEDYSFGDVMMGMIGCQEISMNDKTLSLDLEFSKRELVYAKKSSDFYERCVPLNLIENNSEYFYAIKYPVYVNTYYFLGENDGATDLDQGMNHFRNVAKANKSLILLEKGGHLPLLGLLKDNRFCDEQSEDCSGLQQNKAIENIFKKIIYQDEVSDFDIENLSLLGELKYTLKKNH